MLCKKCGAEYAEETNFCVKCGERIEPTDNTLMKKAKYAIAAAIAVVSIAAIRYFNSVEYLEKRLTDSTWYSEPKEEYIQVGEYSFYDTNYYHYDAKILKFRSNEECEIWCGYGTSRDKVYCFDNLPFEESYSRFWELLDDKTLKLAGEYYEYGKDWYFKGGYLVIDEWTYSDENKWLYSYDD